jgi:hypothetical protein
LAYFITLHINKKIYVKYLYIHIFYKMQGSRMKNPPTIFGLIERYERERGPIESNPDTWGNVIEYIIANWGQGTVPTPIDIQNAIRNHLIWSRGNRRFNPYRGRGRHIPLDPPLHSRTPSIWEKVNANRIIRVLNQNHPSQPQPIPFPDAGFELPVRVQRPLPDTLASPAPHAPPGVTPLNSYNDADECLLCQESITRDQAQNPGIAFCSQCAGRTHLSCYNSMTNYLRDLFRKPMRDRVDGARKCPLCSSPTNWYEYQFSTAEIAAAAAAAAVPIHPASAAAVRAPPTRADRENIINALIQEMLQVKSIDMANRQEIYDFLMAALTKYRNDTGDDIPVQDFLDIAGSIIAAPRSSGGRNKKYKKRSTNKKHHSKKRHNRKRSKSMKNKNK